MHQHIGHGAGYVARVRHGDRDVGRRQRGRVVDAVAHHDHGVALVAQALHVAGLVLGQNLGKVAIQTQVAGNVACTGLGIARDHHQVGEAQLAQAPQDTAGLGARRVADADAAQQHAVLRDVNHRGRPSFGSEKIVQPSGLLDAFVLKDKVGAADADLVAVDARGDTVGHHVAHVGVELLLVHQAAGLRLGHDGAGHAVREVLLDAGRQAQDFFLSGARAANDAAHGGRRVGKGACLVKDHGIGCGQGLKVFAAAHGEAAARGLAHGAHDGQRRRQLDRARVVDHQHGHRLVKVSRDGQNSKEGQEAVGHQAVGELLGT